MKPVSGPTHFAILEKSLFTACNVLLLAIFILFRRFISRFERLFSRTDSNETMKYSLYLLAHLIFQTIIFTVYPVEILR